MIKANYLSPDSNPRVALGMSGGVDSSAAAILLQQQGYSVCGFTLLLCPDASPDDQNVCDARAVCNVLGIEHRVIDMRKRFADTVIADFVSEYSRGRTPNPCIVCNREIKFGAMLDKALDDGFDAVATGHYARIATDTDGNVRIAKDTSAKDQSYVLWSLSQHQLRHMVLPVAGHSKDELRQIARSAGLPVFSKPDSQDICFIPDGDYVNFLHHYAGVTPTLGKFVSLDGKPLGTHKGTVCYTIGQRKGLGGGFAEPMYVTRLDPIRNEITLGPEGSQYATRMICTGVNLQSSIHTKSFYADVKPRYNARPSKAAITVTSSSNGQFTAEVEFTQPQRALTPGQSAVFYDGELLIGGGVIADVLS